MIGAGRPAKRVIIVDPRKDKGENKFSGSVFWMWVMHQRW